MPRTVIALVLLAHGIGHSMGLVQLFKVATINPEWRGDSWILTGTVGTTITQVVGGVVWTAAIVGFAALAAAAMGWLPASSFVPLAIGSADLSIVGLMLFPVAFPTFSSIGALLIDIGVLLAVGWYHWQPSDLAA